MADDTRMTVHCPKCGSTNLCERSVAYADLEIYEWEMDGELPIPSDYDTGVSADWEVMDVDRQYRCRVCEKDSSLNELVVKKPGGEAET